MNETEISLLSKAKLLEMYEELLEENKQLIEEIEQLESVDDDCCCYDEGYEEGKEDGFSKGYDKGWLDALKEIDMHKECL